MHTSLLRSRATRRGLHRLLAPAVGLTLLLGGVAETQAQTLFGIGETSQAVPAGNPFFPAGAAAGTQGILSIDIASGMPLSLATPITGVTAGYRIVGSDFRPNTGELFALAYNATATGTTPNSQLYIIVPTTGVATAVGTPVRLELGGANERIGFDFNPTVDRIRVEGTNGRNYRLNPNNSAIAAVDGNLNYAAAPATTPGVGAVAYTNSFRASSNTTLYALDEINALLSTQSPPNDGVLINPQPVTVDGFGIGSPVAIDIDASFFTSPGTNQAFLIEVTAPNASGLSASNLYNLNLATGAATGRRNIVPALATSPFNIFDIAVSIPAPAPLAAVTGQLVYGVTASNQFISFDSDNPGVIRSVMGLSGVTAGQTLVGTDFRPNTGELFGLGYDASAAAPANNSQVYTINTATGAATAVGSAIRLELGGPMDQIVFDFNPTVDRIRVEGTNDNNYRLNPNNGALAATDGMLAYAAGDLGAGQNPNVGTAAYTNSFVGATSTALFTLDHVLGYVSQQNPANAGVLLNSRVLTGVNGTPGGGTSGAISPINDLDVYYNGMTNMNTAFLAAAAAATPNTSRFFSLGMLGAASANQQATDLGMIGLGISVRDISVTLAPTSTVAMNPGPVTGQLVYAVAGGVLISFDSNNPGVIRSVVDVTGLTAGQTIAGLDFRPANGDLNVFGYNPTTQMGQLYTLNINTGVLTATGSAGMTPLGSDASAIAFDFNPTIDRIRLVSGSNQTNIVINPNDGTFNQVTSLFYSPNPGGSPPAASAVAYTNSLGTATSTQLYGYDQARNTLITIANSAGTSAIVGSSGITVNQAGGVDFDIFTDPATSNNSAFASASTGSGTNDNLYSVNLASGAFSLLGQVGNGSNLSGLAVFLTPVASNTITWNGSVSTAWNVAANWTPAQVPDITNDVLIPGGTPNQPTVSTAQQANNVTLSTGAVLTLASGGTLTSGGNFINNGGSVAGGGTGTLVLNGITPMPTIGGSSVSNFPNLTISTNAASTGGPVGVMNTLTLNGTLTIGAGQPFTLMSNATGTAIVVNNAGGVLAGTATVQRYIDPSRNAGLGYRHYSAPVSGSTVADLATTGFTPVVNPAYNTAGNTVTPFPNVFGYNEARVTLSTNTVTAFDQGYFSPTATSDALEVTRGYTVNISSSALVDFMGTANNGPLSATGLTRGPQPQSGWHLRGNPYPSPLDWQAMIANGRLTGLDNALYVFKSSGQYTGSYASYVAGIGTNGGSRVLPLAQGFFVRTSTAGASGSINFTNAERLINDPANTTFQRNTADTRPLLTLALNGATAATQAAIYFDSNATAAFDRASDAVALPAPNGLTLATEAGSELLAINGQPELTGQDVLLPLHVATTTAGTYSLTVDALNNLPGNYHAYLRDAVSGTFTDLSATPTVALSLAANAPAAGRYAVLFTTQARVLATASAELAALVSVYPNPAHGTATLLLPQALRGTQATTVRVLDNLGRTVLTRTLAAGAAATLELPLGTLAPGVYSVQARTAAGTVAKRLVVE